MSDLKARSQLKSFFKSGAKPSAEQFQAFIDSVLNFKDDGVEKPSGSDTPLKIIAHGSDENLLDFYASDTHTWRINQKPAQSGNDQQQAEGLNIQTNNGGSKLFIESSTGNIGLGTTIPACKLHIEQGALKIVHDSKGLQIESDRIEAIGENQDISLVPKGEGKLKVDGPLQVEDAGESSLNGNLSVAGNVIISGMVNAYVTNPLQYRMYPSDPKVYQNIFDAKDEGIIKRLGDQAEYNDTKHTISNPWNKRPIIFYGEKQEPDGHGAEVDVPEGYDTVWVRLLGNRFNNVKVYFLDGSREQVGQWSAGFRKSNAYCPDGSLADSTGLEHQWLPIPVGRSGKLALIAKTPSEPTGEIFKNSLWFSGLAFSKNPWNHATQSAVGYVWAKNGGDSAIWKDEWKDWNGDVLAAISPAHVRNLKVPVVPSKREKLLYVVEHNDNWNGCNHSKIEVNGKPVERFLSTYDNPFSRHWNSKLYNRYIAARIPVDLIKNNERLLNVTIKMEYQDNWIHFREIGTHDLEVPINS